MRSQLISNVVRRFFLVFVLTGLLTGSVAEAASYQQRQGTIVDPILDNFWNTHDYSGPNLEPGADLYDADLTDADLSNADLTGANLTGADLAYADLTVAILHNADLTGANLHNANLISAILSGSNLYGTDLRHAHLRHADLYNAILSKSDLHNADLANANLYGANLTGANLYGANLYGANLYGANLYGANLTYADLTYADLTVAILHSADLTGANLHNANLIGANLYSVDLTGAWGVETNYGNPYFFGNTLLPVGFDPVAQGWTLSPFCDFTLDAACDLADINQMFEAGNLVTGVTALVSTDRLDLVNNDTIDAADITEWLVQAATTNGHRSPYLRGDTELDRDVDITDFNALASHFDSTGDGDPQNGPLWNEGNFDGDDDTDITDFNLLAANFSPSGYAYVGHTRTIHDASGVTRPGSRGCLFQVVKERLIACRPGTLSPSWAIIPLRPGSI